MAKRGSGFGWRFDLLMSWGITISLMQRREGAEFCLVYFFPASAPLREIHFRAI